MSILSDFEDSVARAVEGVFAGVFRSRVQPAELAKALGKEMDKRRVVGVGKVYAPNLFTVVISPADEQRLGSFTETLAAELATYLVGYAREKGYSLDGRPIVRFRVHDSLKLGRFEVIARARLGRRTRRGRRRGRLLRPPRAAAAAEGPQADDDRRYVASGTGRHAATLGDSPARASSEAAAAAGTRTPGMPLRAAPARQRTLRALSTVTVAGVEHDIVLSGDRVVVGRSPSAGIRLSDANVSREHAAFEEDDGQWVIVDLGSTNGTFVNGEPVERSRLRDGDVITMGVSELVYHQPRG